MVQVNRQEPARRSGTSRRSVQPILVTARSERGGLSENRDAVHSVVPGEDARATLGSLLVVADGLGGAQAGARASRRVVATIEESYYRDPTADPGQALAAAVLAAHDDLVSLGARGRLLACCTAVAITGGRLHVAHVGDGKAFLVRGGRPYTLTRQHRVARPGAPGASEAALDEFELARLERCLGGPRPPRVDGVAPMVLAAGDQVVLCTDGLGDRIDEASVARVAGAPDAADQLLRMARQRATPPLDNLSVIVASWGSGGQSPRRKAGTLWLVLLLVLLAAGAAVTAATLSSPADEPRESTAEANPDPRTRTAPPVGEEPALDPSEPVAVEAPEEPALDPPQPEGPETATLDGDAVRAALDYLARPESGICAALQERVARALGLPSLDPASDTSRETLVRAVAAFQYKLAMPKDGIPGAETLEVLGLAADWPSTCPQEPAP